MQKIKKNGKTDAKKSEQKAKKTEVIANKTKTPATVCPVNIKTADKRKTAGKYHLLLQKRSICPDINMKT
ncbi:MAG: hypothetical protein GXW99_10495 [Clostridiales bacterium]|nr:hypothetical protein [Clostridiales bacterium]